MSIGIAANRAITKSVHELIKNNLTDIDEAYSLTEDNLDLTIKVRITPTREVGGVNIQSDLAFVKGVKVKDSQRVDVDENQKELFKDPEYAG